METDITKLKKDIIEIFNAYLKGAFDEAIKNKAKDIHKKFANVSPALDKDLAEAIHLLVDLGWDLPNPKPQKQRILNLIEKLKSDAAR